jgi:Flp pilus assembly protein TadD
MTALLVAYARDCLGTSHGVTGHCLSRNAQYAEAVDVLTRAIQGEEGIGVYWNKFFLAMAYQQLGKYDLAGRRLTEANQAVADEKTLAARPATRFPEGLT